MNEISKSLRNHYSSCFNEHGPTSMGVDWGQNQSAADIRTRKILEILKHAKPGSSLLDVGCGYGALVDHIPSNLDISYYGIDVAPNMIEYAENNYGNFGTFYCNDFLDWEPNRRFDYIVCNGILTQKLEASHLNMLNYSQKLLKKMYSTSTIGIAFNCMSTFVNFQKSNLFYRSPSEFVSWCMSELSSRVVLDSAYDLWYEYMIYVFHRLELTE